MERGGKLSAIRYTLSALLFLYALRCPLSAGFAEESSYSKAVTAYNNRHLDEALRYAKQAVLDYPHQADPFFLLGELYYLRQELTQAQEFWQRALRLDPSRVEIRSRLDQLEKEMRVEKKLSRNDTHPFVVRFKDENAIVDLAGLKSMLRETYRVVGQSFDYFPDHPITVLLYPRADFEKTKAVGIHRVGGLYDGKIRLPIPSDAAYPAQELQAVLWHEYTHALVHDLAKGRCPVWLNEGIAQMEEARIRPVNPSRAYRAFRERQLVSWQDLWVKEYEPASLDLLYPESYLVAQYLVKRWGWGKLTALLEQLGAGHSMDESLRLVYKMDPGTLEKEWGFWVHRLQE